jgi:hypothetical protein
MSAQNAVADTPRSNAKLANSTMWSSRPIRASKTPRIDLSVSAIDAKLARRDGRSFLRPDYLLPARNDLKTGHIAAAELRGDRPRRRDLLIEHLHLIQDKYGHLSAPHLAALAQEMKLALTEV